MESTNSLPAVNPSNLTPLSVQPLVGQIGIDDNPSTAQNPQMAAALHQVAAMHQQYQQVLVMQQMYQARQAAEKAATLKSAAEMAAARAAEISKQLKGGDADEEKPPQRSKSRSPPSHSASRSRSKSRSVSPIRYQRGRSVSPIRYRRDYHSPSRARDYHGYRSRGYRNYYRGSHFDYARYRYGRDRDFYYRRRSRSRPRRRSRTKSRSPVRSRSKGTRRSHSVSTSPKRTSHSPSSRRQRERDDSPKHKRDQNKRHMTLRQSASRERARTPSQSSASISLGKMESGSPGIKKASQSNDYIDNPLEEGKMSPSMERSNQGRNHSSPSKGGKRLSKGTPANIYSPTTSLSVSLDKDSGNDAVNSNDAEQDVKRKTQDVHRTERTGSAEWQMKNSIKPPVSKPTEACDGQKKTDYPAFKREIQFSLKQNRARKPAVLPNAFLDEESEGDTVLDDWRNDLRRSPREKGVSAHTSSELDKTDNKLDRKGDKAEESVINVHRADLQGMNHWVGDSASGHNLKQGTTIESHTCTVTEGLMMEGNSPYARDRSLTVQEKEFNLAGNRLIGAMEDTSKRTEEEDIEAKVNEDLSLEYTVFEGPKPASEERDEGMCRSEGQVDPIQLRSNSDQHPSTVGKTSTDSNRRGAKLVENGVGKISVPFNEDNEVLHSRYGKELEDGNTKHDRRRDRHKRHKKKRRHQRSDQEDKDDVDASNDDDDRHKRHKKRRHHSFDQDDKDDADTSNDDADRHKRHKKKRRHHSSDQDDKDDGDTSNDDDDRHKKHKKKRRHHSSDQEDQDDGVTSNDDNETHRTRKRHKRKHKKEGEHGHKERKKRKHKHRRKSLSVSSEQCLPADEEEARRMEEGRAGKKRSSKHRKKSKRDVSKSQSLSLTPSD